jgi:hypothetical protein
MSDQENSYPKEPSLIDPVSEKVSTDVIQEIKSGIFGLFINMYNNMSVRVGPVESMKYCILYLQEIVDHCQKALLDNEKNIKDK